MLLRNILVFSSASALGQVMRVLQEFVVRGLLPPEIMGAWNFVMVVRNFGASLDLGVSTAARRGIARFHGAADVRSIVVYARTAFPLQVLQYGLIGLGIIGYALVFADTQDTESFGLYAAAAIILLAGAPANLFAPIYQSVVKYPELSKRLAIYWPVFAVLLIAGAYLAEVTGLIVATVLALVFQAVLLRSGLRAEFGAGGAKWSMEAAKDLFAVGIPLRAVDYPMVLFQMLDTLFVAKFMKFELLAIYVTAKIVLTQMGQVPAWIGNVLITRIFTETGAKTKSRRQLGHEFYIYLRFYYLAVTPLLICGADVAVTFLIGRFLPDYRETLSILVILLFVVYFMPNATVVRNFWAADKRYAPLFVTNMVALLSMTAGLGFLVATDRVSLGGVAVVYLLSHVSYFVVLIAMIGPELWRRTEIGVLGACLLCSILVTLLALYAGGGLERGEALLSFMELLVGAAWELAIVAPVVIAGLLWTRAAT